jgi:hypothetical protein
VNAGDVGTTVINPTNDLEWLLATPPDSVSGVNLFRCQNRISCHTQDFASDQIADSNSLNGDAGPFDLPVIFDPFNASDLLIGTCRVWRGTPRGSWRVVEQHRISGGNGVCSGNETNVARSLAAGGPVDSNGYSQLIYAGTDGDGPWSQRRRRADAFGSPPVPIAAPRPGPTAPVPSIRRHSPYLQ